MSKPAAADKMLQKSAKKSDGAQSIHRTFDLVRIVAKNNDRGANLSKIAREAGLTASTAHRILNALIKEGILCYNALSKRYNLGIGLYLLGSEARQYQLRDIYHTTLERISQQSGGTAFLIIRSGYDVLCIDRVIGTTPIQILVFDVGAYHPLGVGAGSLAILACLPDDEADKVFKYNEQRYAAFRNYTPQDLNRMIRFYRKHHYITNCVTPRTTGVGVALYDSANQLIGAVSVSRIASEMNKQREKEIARLIQAQIKWQPN